MAERPWKFESSRPHHITPLRSRPGDGFGAMSPSQGAMMAETPQPRRAFGFWVCLALVIGNVVGSGVYLLPAALAPLGWNALFGWIATIGGCLCLAFVFACLARSFPAAGGPYAYTLAAFGDGAGFAVAWGFWISVLAANAAIAIAAVSYLSIYAPGFGALSGAPAAAAIGFVWLLTLINCVSLRGAGRLQVVTTLIKLLPLAAAIVISSAVVAGDGGGSLAPFEPGEISLGAINAAAALTVWAMIGFESATVPAEDVRNAERVIPRATIAGTLIAGILYLLACTGIALLLPPEQAAASDAPFADFIGVYLGRGAALLVALFAAISALGALNGWVLIQGQLPLAMARRGAFPRWFATVSAAGTPVRAQLVSSALVTVLIVSNYQRTMGALFVFMALVSSAIALFVYLACAASLLRMQRDGRIERRPMATLAAATGILFSLWAIYGAGAEAAGWSAALMASAVPVYLLMRRSLRAPLQPGIAGLSQGRQDIGTEHGSGHQAG